MAWTPLTNLAHTRLWEHLNNLATQLTADFTAAILAPRPKFSGTEVALVGANPPAGTLIITQQFRLTGVTTTGTGDFACTFPTAFPNGVVGFMAAPNSGCSMTPGYKPAYSLARGWVLCLSGASVAVANGTAIDVSATAWGW